MNAALLLLHGLVGLLFVGHGLQKLFGSFGGDGLEGTAQYMDSLGLRPARVHAVMAGGAELTGGILVALGLLLPVGAMLIVGVMFTAARTEHRGKGIWVDGGGFELPLVHAAVVLALAAAGGGQYSLDEALGLDVRGIGWALGALALGVAGSLTALAGSRLAPLRRHTHPAAS